LNGSTRRIANPSDGNAPLRKFGGRVGEPDVAVERNIELPLARLRDGVNVACLVPCLEHLVGVTREHLGPGTGFFA
jgi:hypothetical protein